MKKLCNGFLLLQLSIALAMIMLMLSMAMPPRTLLTNRMVRMEAEKLIACIWYAQRRALLLAKDQHIVFNIADNSYQLEERKEQLPSLVTFGFLEGTQGPPAKPDHMLIQPISFGHCKLTAYAHGDLQSGSIYLTDKEHSVMYAITSGVAHVAYVRLYRFDTKWVLII